MRSAHSPPANTVILPGCPVCGSRKLRTRSRPGHPIGEPVFGPYLNEFGVMQCRECRMEFANPRPASHLLNEFYGSQIYECHQMDLSDAKVRKSRWLMDRILSQGPYSGRNTLLDFGCGGGYFLRYAREAGWEAMGFDVGEEAMATCRAHGLPATSRTEELPRGHFDVILLNHVFEHVEDPPGLLELLRQLLHPEGALAIVVPNVRSARARLSLPLLSRYAGFDERHRAFPIHLWYFSPRTLPRLLEQNHFRPVMVTTFGMGLEELILRNGANAAPASGGDSAAARSAPPAPRKGWKEDVKRIFFGAGLGENLLVIAKPD